MNIKVLVVPLKIISTAQIVLMLCCSPVLGFRGDISPARVLHVRSLTLQNHITFREDTASDIESHAVWVPPTQNTYQLRGNIFSIRDPDDLLQFISEEERLCVGKLLLVMFLLFVILMKKKSHLCICDDHPIVKVYANWCRTCKAFDTRYRKLASQLGDQYNDMKSGKGTKIIRGKAKFAEMEYADSSAKLLVALLGTEKISLPYILMYRGSDGLVKSFPCAPKNINMLVNTVNELANNDTVDDSFEKGDMNKHYQVVTRIPHDEDHIVNAAKSREGVELGATHSYLSSLKRAS